ncbi:MAG: hypothetical protein HGA87_06045, partial [Desulfobulbaceae bacterium]|nr:hypothetical protein [Desulfobulbaceae bacterium]
SLAWRAAHKTKVLPALQQALQQSSAVLALQLRDSNGIQHRWSAGELVIVYDDGEYEFRLRSRQRLRVCPECRAVLPVEQFNAHQSISLMHHVCAQSRQIAAIESPRVYLVALFDACKVLQVFVQNIRALLNGYQSELHDTIHTWLEDTVYPLFETLGSIDERFWLLGLCQAIDVFLDIIHDNRISSFTSQEIRDVLRYKDVIDALLRRIQEY